uniref:Uncharacterized protein n=1 Tax=Cannabis sativa TaxID=3483 RepID=A0A803QT93_CANSA
MDSTLLLDLAKSHTLNDGVSNSFSVEKQTILLNPRHVRPHLLSYHFLHHPQKLCTEERFLKLIALTGHLSWFSLQQ